MKATTAPAKIGSRTVAHLVAGFLVRRGVHRVYGLCGGHIQPIWDEVARAGIQIVDVRHESAAVYMAQAQADLTGSLGVAIVTAGPGLTNATTGIANASVSRSPVLVISGRPPRPQAGMGALQDIPQGDLVRPICRRVEVVSERHHVLPRLEATVRAAEGVGTPAGLHRLSHGPAPRGNHGCGRGRPALRAAYTRKACAFAGCDIEGSGPDP